MKMKSFILGKGLKIELNALMCPCAYLTNSPCDRVTKIHAKKSK